MHAQRRVDGESLPSGRVLLPGSNGAAASHSPAEHEHQPQANAIAPSIDDGPEVWTTLASSPVLRSTRACARPPNLQDQPRSCKHGHCLQRSPGSKRKASTAVVPAGAETCASARSQPWVCAARALLAPGWSRRHRSAATAPLPLREPSRAFAADSSSALKPAVARRARARVPQLAADSGCRAT